MKNKGKIIVLAAALAFSLCSCKAQNVTAGMGEGEVYDAVITVKGGQLAALADLLGKTDEEAALLLGGGEENRTADGSYLVGRNYTAELFGSTCPVYSSYDEDGRVFMVLAELNGMDAGECAEKLDEITGVSGSEVLPDPEIEEESNKEEETRIWEWNGCQLTLFASGELVTLDLMKSSP